MVSQSMSYLRQQEVDKVYKEIEQVLETEVRPYLREHHGDIEIVDFKDGVLTVRFLGGCSCCPSVHYTVENVVEKELTENFDYIKKVVVAEPEIDEEAWALAKKLLSGQRID